MLLINVVCARACVAPSQNILETSQLHDTCHHYPHRRLPHGSTNSTRCVGGSGSLQSMPSDQAVVNT